MLIKTASSRILSNKYIHSYAVEDAANARHYANGSGTTTHHNAPESGFVVVSWNVGAKALSLTV